VGLGSADEPVKVTVRWPSGQVSRLGGLAISQTHEIIEPGARETATPQAHPAAR
jgi:hypothetical protein